MTTTNLIETMSDITQLIDCIVSAQVVEVPTSDKGKELTYALLAQIMGAIKINDIRTSDGWMVLEESDSASVINYIVLADTFRKSTAVPTNELIRSVIINCYNHKLYID